MGLAEDQRRFAAHLRDPGRVPAPAGIEARRMDVYRDLFFNNVAGLLAGSFPVCRRLLAKDGWNALVRRFYSTHQAHTPYFLELPREFVEWLGATGTAGDEPAFLPELAHYEWVELALAIAEDPEQPPPAASDENILSAPLSVSPLAWPLAYRWPVHRLGPDHRPGQPPAEPTFLVVYRDDGDAVQFLEVSAGTAAMLDALEREPGLTAFEALEKAGADHGGDARTAILDLGRRGVLRPAPR